MLALLLLAAAAADTGGDATAIPPPIRAMIEAAIQSDDEGALDALVKYARIADPASGDATLRLVDEWRGARAEARNERLRNAGVFELWTGRVEAGGFVSTGNSDVTGLTASADVTRESLTWRHKLRMQADYQRSAGVTSREHYLAAYDANWKVHDRLYVYGTGLFESDRFFGYSTRFSGSAGAGYSALQTPRMTLAVELGPAFRHTAFTDARTETSAAARGSLDFDWHLGPGVTLRQDASAYVQRFNSTVSGTTALAARLVGPLSAQFSYTVQYESMPPVGRVSTDTVSRASVVYSF